MGKRGEASSTVPIAAELAEELVEWRKQSKDPSPEAFIFPGRLGGFMDTSNFRHRVLHKLAEELELPKLTFQVIRRTIATLAKRKGTVKDVQGMMRHSRTATTTDVYMQELPEGVRATINSIHQELVGTGTDGPRICNVRCRLIFTSNRTPDRARKGEDGSHNKGRERVFRARRKHKFKTFRDEGFDICCQNAAKGEERRSSKCLKRIGGPDRDRTDDLFHAMEARSQLRHRPTMPTLLFSLSLSGSSTFANPVPLISAGGRRIAIFADLNRFRELNRLLPVSKQVE